MHRRRVQPPLLMPWMTPQQLPTGPVIRVMLTLMRSPLGTAISALKDCSVSDAFDKCSPPPPSEGNRGQPVRGRSIGGSNRAAYAARERRGPRATWGGTWGGSNVAEQTKVEAPGTDAEDVERTSGSRQGLRLGYKLGIGGCALMHRSEAQRSRIQGRLGRSRHSGGR